MIYVMSEALQSSILSMDTRSSGPHLLSLLRWGEDISSLYIWQTVILRFLHQYFIHSVKKPRRQPYYFGCFEKNKEQILFIENSNIYKMKTKMLFSWLAAGCSIILDIFRYIHIKLIPINPFKFWNGNSSNICTEKNEASRWKFEKQFDRVC